MNKTIVGAVAFFAVFVGLGFLVLSPDGGHSEGVSVRSAVVYKTPTCGCCSVYISYMKREGYAVTTKNVDDIQAIKKRLGVPTDLESCHTTEVSGYVVEGHVPHAAVNKLLAEQPNDVAGIGMAGMPAGSPGMPGPKTDDFIIYEITHEGAVGDVFVTI